jgi:hypothetical protein
MAQLAQVDGTGGSIYVVTTTGLQLNKSAIASDVLPAGLARQVEGIVGQLKSALTLQVRSHAGTCGVLGGRVRAADGRAGRH